MEKKKMKIVNVNQLDKGFFVLSLRKYDINVSE